MKKLSTKQIEVLSYLLDKSGCIDKSIVNALHNDIEYLDDGGMGSLIFISDKKDDERTLGEKVFEAEFKDIDDITVIMTLNLDNYGKLYELDMWKVDYSPLCKFPEIQNIQLM